MDSIIKCAFYCESTPELSVLGVELSRQYQVLLHSISERRVQKYNKKFNWLGSNSAADVFDSNSRDQAEQYLILSG